MADKYLYNAAAGTADGSSWTNAYTTFETAVAGMAAGDTLWVANDHVQTSAVAINVTVPGSTSAMTKIVSAKRVGGSTPPVAADFLAGGYIGSNSTLSLAGSFYTYGVTFDSGVGASSGISINLASGSRDYQRFESCNFKLSTTGSTGRISITDGSARVDIINATVEFSNASHGIIPGSYIRWFNKSNSSALLGTALTSGLIKTSTSSTTAPFVMDGLDLSTLNTTIIPSSTNNRTDIKLISCKLPAGYIIAAPTDVASIGYDIIGCNSGGTYENNERYTYSGVLTTNTTVKRTSGATDGTTSYSWKIASSSTATQLYPFDSFEGALWNTSTGTSKTLTIHTVTDNVTLNNNELWLEVFYLGGSTAPITTKIISGPATYISTGTALTSDSAEAWTTTGLTTPVKQKMSVSFTPQMIGPVRWRVKMAKPSTTVYVCPKPDLT